MAVKAVKLDRPVQRIALIAVFLAYLTGSFFFAKWYFGNSVSIRSANKEVAAVAVGLAPADPQTHFALAVLTEDTFLPEDRMLALAEYQQTAAASPADFRVWLALGKALERNGDPNGAELALRHALGLAPEYAQIHWTLGNVLLRQGKTAGAYAGIRRAAESDRTYLEPAVSTAWQIFDGDLTGIRENLGDSAEMNFVLATFLAKQKLFDQALEIWTTLPAEAKKTTFRETGRILADEMVAARKYRDALEIRNQIGAPESGTLEAGRIFNGGFEMNVDPDTAGLFEWQIGAGLMPQIGFDDIQKHGGNRSLVILFNSEDGRDFRTLEQTVAITGGGKYRFRIFYKSDLKTAATLRWEIVDPTDGRLLASADALPAVSDWAESGVGFAAPETIQAVTVRLVRVPCERGICPITGRVWFDDASISRE